VQGKILIEAIMRAFAKNNGDRGAGLSEYMLLVGLLLVTGIIAMRGFGTNLGCVFVRENNAVSSMTGSIIGPWPAPLDTCGP
jgi:Flp pilus assembly pilin Flp